jgi:AcrR family transcriptional regulator
VSLDAPNSNRVARKRQQRKERILEAAFAAIAESGPAEFSLNQLARDLDYTPGALYWYFPSKDALVVAVQGITLAELAGWIVADRDAWESLPQVARSEPQTKALSTLLRLARFYLGLEQSAPKHARIIAFSLDPRVWLGDEELKTLGPVLRALFEPSTTAFAQAEQCGALTAGRPVIRAIQYWNALQGTLLAGKLARIDAGLFDANLLGADTAKTLLLGWGAPVPALERALGLVQSESAK